MGIFDKLALKIVSNWGLEYDDMVIKNDPNSEHSRRLLKKVRNQKINDLLNESSKNDLFQIFLQFIQCGSLADSFI